MLLGVLITLPLIFSLLLFALPDTGRNKVIALSASLLSFVVSVILLFSYMPDPLHFPVFHPVLIHALGIEFTLGLDGLSLLLVLLTTLLTPLIIFTTFGDGITRRNSYYALVLLMEMALIGVFTTTDILLFYIFWEIALIPIFFISALWGGQNARAITFKFFMYTLVG